MKPIIKIENLSKQYRLGEIGTGTLSHDLNRWWHTVRGKEDPYLQIGEANDRATKGNSDYVWAMQNINLNVMPGEVLGIIGKNGAGKSTLLKVLSRVTAPTTGSIKTRGRMASLLEVGTGFHPELTGRENIFLNGAILGMTKREIKSKFDEIVDFAGCERYIDTPVKRYSSGMYVRLAFAVAAHLDPEILIVDEVLAVGDAEFQNKAIGKMKDVSSNEGRTVLFVSHNMNAVKTLCKTGIVLNKGLIDFSGTADNAVKHYLNLNSLALSNIKDNINYLNSDIKINAITVNNSEQNYLSISNDKTELNIVIEGELKSESILTLEIDVFDINQNKVAFFGPGMVKGLLPTYKAGKFIIQETFNFPKNMAGGKYIFDINLTHPYVQYHMNAHRAFNLEYTGREFVSGENNYGNRGYIILE